MTPPRALVEEVAAIAAMDAGEESPTRRDIDLAEKIIALVRRACAEELRAMAKEPGIDGPVIRMGIRQAADRIERGK